MVEKKSGLHKQIKDLKETQRELEISEVKYRKLFETAKDGILLIDPETDKIIDANPYILELIGYTYQEIVGKKLWEIGVFRDIELTKNAFVELKEKGYMHYEDLPLENKNGQEKSVEFVSNLYPVGDIHMIQCNIRDITDRKIAENKSKVYMEGLEKINRFMTGRELKMVDLKKEIEQLKRKIEATEEGGRN